jgi:hypothetical protein
MRVNSRGGVPCGVALPNSDGVVLVGSRILFGLLRDRDERRKCDENEKRRFLRSSTGESVLEEWLKGRSGVLTLRVDVCEIFGAVEVRERGLIRTSSGSSLEGRVDFVEEEGVYITHHISTSPKIRTRV